MAEEIINDIYYRLDEENLTAEVIQKDDYRGDIIIPDAVVFNEITYRVTSIGRRAFADCQWLTTINIPNSVTSIGERAFIWCFALDSITIPDSVKRIGWKAFLDCESLEEIIIGNSVKGIGRHAFDGCDSLLSIAYQGTMAQWKKIKLGYFWKTPIPTAVLHCTDGDVKV